MKECKKLMMTCPRCGNTTWLSREDGFECTACGEFSYPEDMSSEVSSPKYETLSERDTKLESLWAELGDIPMDPETECLEAPFLDFPAGTPRDDLWHWFDERHRKGVAYLLYSDGVDRTPELAQLCYLKQLCTEFDSESCVFNPHGVCLAPFVTGHAPAICDDGCGDYCYKEV